MESSIVTAVKAVASVEPMAPWKCPPRADAPVDAAAVMATTVAIATNAFFNICIHPCQKGSPAIQLGCGG
jgi:hypothetical protein